MKLASIEGDLLELQLDLKIRQKHLASLSGERTRLIKQREDLAAGLRKATEHVRVLKTSKISILSEYGLVKNLLASFHDKIQVTEAELEKVFTYTALQTAAEIELKKSIIELENKVNSHNSILEFPVDPRRSKEED